MIYIQTSVFFAPCLSYSWGLSPSLPPHASLPGRQAIPLMKLRKSNLRAFIEFKGVHFVVVVVVFVCHIATCTFYLFPWSVGTGLETGTMNEWTEVHWPAPLPAYEECCQWGCEWCHSSGHGCCYYYHDIILFYCISFFWLERTSSLWSVATSWFLFIFALRSCMGSGGGGDADCVVGGWAVAPPGSSDPDYCTNVVLMFW